MTRFSRTLALVLVGALLWLTPAKVFAHSAFSGAMGGMGGHGGGGGFGGGHGGSRHGQARGGRSGVRRSTGIVGGGGVVGATTVAGGTDLDDPPPRDFTHVTRPYVRLGFGYLETVRWREPSANGALRLDGNAGSLQLSVGVMIHDRLALHADLGGDGLSFADAKLGSSGWTKFNGRGNNLFVGGGITIVQHDSGFIATFGVGTGRNTVRTAGSSGHSRFGVACYGGVGYRIPLHDQRGSHVDVLARVVYLNAPDESRVSVWAPGVVIAVER